MIELCGVFRIEYDPPPGLPGWGGPLIIRNGPTTEGVNYLLETAFRGGSQVLLPNWYLGIISGAGYSAIRASDTIASHSGWSEYSSFGGSPARKKWNPTVAASGGLVSGGAIWTTTGPSALLRGVFLTSSPNVGDPGILYSTAVDPVGAFFGNGGQLRVTYDLRLRPRS